MFNKEESKQVTISNKREVEKIKNRLFNYENDINRIERLKVHKCKYCYYINCDRVVMDIITEGVCKNCAKFTLYPDNHTDRYCDKCSEKYNICKHCGAQLD